MSNAFKVIDFITKESTRILHEKLSFINTTDKQYDDSFKDSGGGKKGSVIRVRRPNQYTVRTGMKMNVQDQDEISDTFTVASMKGVDMKFNHQELVQSVNSDSAFDDLSSKYIEPAVSVLASNLEAEFLTYATQATYNLVGSAGSAITTIEIPGLARARLNQCLAPKESRYIQMGSVEMAKLVNGAVAYFNPQTAIAKQYTEGLISRTSMADYYENERIWTMRNGDDVAGAIVGASTSFTEGCTTVNMGSLGTTMYKGQVFTIADMYACHPETKAAYPFLQQFVVTADPTIGGNAGDVSFSPAIYTTGAKKNVCTALGADVTWTSGGQNGKVTTFVGLANASYAQQLMYQREAFQFCTMDLPIMDDSNKCMRKSKDGISIRVWQGSDIVNGELLMRLDILYGMAALNPNFACRMIGAANT